MISRGMILAAGMGTRLAPITPFVPKEMLPICGFPAIHHALWELSEAGIKEVMVVVSADKAPLVDYLTKGVSPKGEIAVRRSAERDALLERVQLVFAEQKNLLGTADAIFLAKDFMRDGPIVVLYPDDLLSVTGHFSDGVSSTRALVREASETGASVLLAEEIPGDRAGNYGVLTLRSLGGHIAVNGIVEKPHDYVDDRAYALIGRMILTPEAIRSIPSFERTDASGIIPVLRREAVQGRLFAVLHRGRRYDVGSHEGYAAILRDCC